MADLRAFCTGARGTGGGEEANGVLVVIAEVVVNRGAQREARRTLEGRCHRGVATIFRPGVVQAPGHIPCVQRVFAAQGIGEGVLFHIAVIDAGIDARAIGCAIGRVVAVDVGRIGVADAGRIGALIQANEEVVPQFIVMEHRVDGAREDSVVVVGAVVEAQGRRVVLARQTVVLVLMFAGEALGRVNGVAQVRVGFPVVRGHLALVVGTLCQHAQAAIEQHIGVGHGGVQLVAAAQVHAASAHFARDLLAGIVEARAGDDVDVACHSRTGHGGHDGLLHDDLFGDGGRNIVKARGAAFRAHDAQAVEGKGGPVVGRTAQVHVTRLALVALDPHAWQTAYGEGDVLVGQVADGIGGQHADQGVGVALNLQRRCHALRHGAAHTHGDLVDFFAGRLRIGAGAHAEDGGAQQQGSDSVHRGSL